MTFEELKLDSSICKALYALGYDFPLPVQKKVIPEILKQSDLIVKSKTGSGKTASFALPIIQSIKIDEKNPQALVLCPTRELAMQIKEEFDSLGMYKKIKTLLLTGKQPFRFQKEDLKQRCHVVIGTPGRILDHLEQGNLVVSHIQYVIMDEADEMLNMNFIEDIQAIYGFLTRERTSCIFSATYPSWIQKLSMDFLYKPKIIEIQNQEVSILEYFYSCIEENKNDFLLKILTKYKPESCIVFCKTQVRVEDLYAFLLENQISCNRLHGNMMQEDRFTCIKDFKQAKFRILVATDVAARGIDVEKVDLVINYDMPSPVEFYVHRIGRSARVNEKGIAISLLGEYDEIRKEKLEEYLHKKIEYNNDDILSIRVEQEEISELSISNRVFKDKKKDLRKDVLKLYINGGKSKKIRPGDIVGAICEIDGVTAQDIGVIQVQDNQSYVDILNSKGQIVLDNLKMVKKKRIRVQVAK